MVIGLDPGHGGDDKGAAGNGIVESAYNLHLCMAIRSRLMKAYRRLRVVLLRKSDDTMSFAARSGSADANKCDLVLSIHVNAAVSKRQRGALCFHWPGNVVGESVGNAISRAMPIPLLRIGDTSIPATPGDDDATRWLQAPANVLGAFRQTAVLVEVGYLTHPSDCVALLDHWVQKSIITAIQCGVDRYRTMVS